MSSNWMIFLELSLVFGVVFGFGLNELRQLKKYRTTQDEKHDSVLPAAEVESLPSSASSGSVPNNQSQKGA